jgi:hypothetical protein
VIIDGKKVLNDEVIIARRLEGAGRSVRDLAFIRWRVAELAADIADDAEFWGIDRRDIARSRAEQLATARGVTPPVVPIVLTKSLELLDQQTAQPELSESAREASGQ